MASSSSKALPYISLAIGFTLAILSQVWSPDLISALVALLPVLGVTAGGGLYNKHVEAGVERYKVLKDDPNFQKIVTAAVSEAVKKGSSS